MPIKLFCAALLSIVAISRQSTKCMDFDTVPLNFDTDLPKVEGKWFAVLRDNDIRFDVGTKCTQVDFTALSTEEPWYGKVSDALKSVVDDKYDSVLDSLRSRPILNVSLSTVDNSGVKHEYTEGIVSCVKDTTNCVMDWQ